MSNKINIELNRIMIAHDLNCEIGLEFNLTDLQYEALCDFITPLQTKIEELTDKLEMRSFELKAADSVNEQKDDRISELEAAVRKCIGNNEYHAQNIYLTNLLSKNK